MKGKRSSLPRIKFHNIEKEVPDQLNMERDRAPIRVIN